MDAMASTLVIGNKNYSSWSLRPWLLLRHYGVPFTEQRLLLDTPEFAAQVARWSPSRRVPALHDGDLVLWDSLAICEYANERWLDGKAWPADIALRAVARCAAAEMHSGFGALRSQLPMNVRRQPRLPHWDAGADADIARVQEIWRDLRARSGDGGPFLCGDRFGIVDAMFAPVCVRFRGYGVPLDAAATSYLQAIFALPAMCEWEAAALAETERVASDEA
jgi:glutathione S-transferase